MIADHTGNLFPCTSLLTQNEIDYMELPVLKSDLTKRCYMCLVAGTLIEIRYRFENTIKWYAFIIVFEILI